jgi:hypothetical protein
VVGVMILSLISGGLSMINSAGFLLMSVGPGLLEFITLSSIYALTSWVSVWLLPAAISYREDQMRQLRLLQMMVVVIATVMFFASNPGIMALFFVLMMLIEVWIFPQYVLLFKSKSEIYLRVEIIRGFANSTALIIVIFALHGEPIYYVLMLLVNSSLIGLALSLSGIHHPVAFAVSGPAEAIRIIRASLLSRQFVALILARALETGTIMVMNQMQAISAIISLKLGIALASTLAANSRKNSLIFLWIILGLIYYGCTGAIILLNKLTIKDQLIPEALFLVKFSNAIMIAPIIFTAFTLTVLGLRMTNTNAK